MSDYTAGIVLAQEPGKVFMYTIKHRRFRKPKVRVLREDEFLYMELSIDGADNLRNLVINPGEFKGEIGE